MWYVYHNISCNFYWSKHVINTSHYIDFITRFHVTSVVTVHNNSNHFLLPGHRACGQIVVGTEIFSLVLGSYCSTVVAIKIHHGVNQRCVIAQGSWNDLMLVVLHVNLICVTIIRRSQYQEVVKADAGPYDGSWVCTMYDVTSIRWMWQSQFSGVVLSTGTGICGTGSRRRSRRSDKPWTAGSWRFYRSRSSCFWRRAS